jgi:hypothetical protein
VLLILAWRRRKTYAGGSGGGGGFLSCKVSTNSLTERADNSTAKGTYGRESVCVVVVVVVVVEMVVLHYQHVSGHIKQSPPFEDST